MVIRDLYLGLKRRVLSVPRQVFYPTESGRFRLKVCTLKVVKYYPIRQVQTQNLCKLTKMVKKFTEQSTNNNLFTLQVVTGIRQNATVLPYCLTSICELVTQWLTVPFLKRPIEVLKWSIFPPLNFSPSFTLSFPPYHRPFICVAPTLSVHFSDLL